MFGAFDLRFVYEDWTLLSTRYELHLLLHSFKADLDDPDRPSFGDATAEDQRCLG